MVVGGAKDSILSVSADAGYTTQRWSQQHHQLTVNKPTSRLTIPQQRVNAKGKIMKNHTRGPNVWETLPKGEFN
jgi:hypothetical protein